MANLLKLVSIGSPPSKDKHSIEPLVAAGLGYHAHVAIPLGAEAAVIDASHQVESDVHQTAREELPHMVTVPVQHSLSAVGHTWITVEQNVQALDHIAIPWVDSIDQKATSVFQGHYAG